MPWISPAYERSYRKNQTWHRNLIRKNPSEVQFAVVAKNPGMAASAAKMLGGSYAMNGVVRLLDGDPNGWREIECGYRGLVYARRFYPKWWTSSEYVSQDNPSIQYALRGEHATELVMLSGLARLFGQTSDLDWLNGAIARYFTMDGALGSKHQFGRLMLDSILHPELPIPAEQLAKDRRECCQKRDTEPFRPTTFNPFGILDIEMMLRYPEESRFDYSGQQFAPAHDINIERAVNAYHQWYAD